MPTNEAPTPENMGLVETYAYELSTRDELNGWLGQTTLIEAYNDNNGLTIINRNQDGSQSVYNLTKDKRPSFKAGEFSTRIILDGEFYDLPIPSIGNPVKLRRTILAAGPTKYRIAQTHFASLTVDLIFICTPRNSVIKR